MSKVFVLLAAAATLGAAAPAMASAAPTAAPKPAAPAAKQQAAPTRAALLKGLDAGFKAIDTNGDGFLSAAEAQAAEGKVIQQRVARARTNVEAEFMAAAPTGSNVKTDGAAIVTQLDKNKDGKISADEYRAPRLAMFDKLDTNHDGTISATERQAAPATRKR